MHILAANDLTEPVRKAKVSGSNCGKSQAVQGRAKGHGAGLGAPGGSDADAKPEHGSESYVRCMSSLSVSFRLLKILCTPTSPLALCLPRTAPPKTFQT